MSNIDVLEKMLDDPRYLRKWAGLRRTVVFRALEILRRLNHLDHIEMTAEEDGIILAREEGSRMIELEIMSNGKLGVSIDCELKLDLDAIEVLRVLGEAR